VKFEKSKIFLFFCLSFVAGVGAGRYVNYYIMAIAAMFFLILITIWWSDKRFVLAGFLGLVALFGAVRYQASFPDQENFIGKYYGQEVELEGIIVKEPDVRSDKVNLTVKVTSPSPPSLRARLRRTLQGRGVEEKEGKERELTGNILLNVGKYPEYQYGDRLKFSGKVEEPFVSEEFSYKDYLSRYDTYAVMRFPKIEKIGEDQGNKMKAALLSIKHRFQGVLSQILPEPHNALAQGLILGVKHRIPEDLKNAMIAVGVSHIIVISGYNMSIITQNILKTRQYVGRRSALVLSFLLVLAFVVITGADASVVRAAVMAMLAVAALNVGRIYVSLNALIFVAALMVLENPKILGFDLGFQLSFMATAGLIYLGSWFENKLQWVPNILEFRKNLASTMAAQIFALPLLIFYFERLSIVSIVVNVLILWTVPYAMFLALTAGVLGMIYVPVAKILAVVLWGILAFQIWVVEFFARIPFAQVALGVPVAGIFVYYAVLFWRLRKFPARNLLIFTSDVSQKAKI